MVALGDLFGGVAVLDADDGAVRALAGIAFSSPQPPGSTFKVITTVAALEEDAVKLTDSSRSRARTTRSAATIDNASDELCGGTFVESFAHSCNTVFAPLGAEVGGERLVARRREVRLQLAAAALRRGGDRGDRPAREHDPGRRSEPTSTSASARSGRARCWRLRCSWLRSRRRSRNGGMR